VKFDARAGTSSVEFIAIDASLIEPTARTYGKKDVPTSGAKPAPAMATAS